MSEQQRHQAVVDATEATEASMRVQPVPVNVFETSGALVIVAPLPAVTADDVTIELRDTCLRFYATVRSAAPRNYLVHEWDYGGYERQVELPEGYGAKIEASLGQGQLAIRVLKGDPTGDVIEVKPNAAVTIDE
jgi:HSP20 family molecular chaperone IbpA